MVVGEGGGINGPERRAGEGGMEEMTDEGEGCREVGTEGEGEGEGDGHGLLRSRKCKDVEGKDGGRIISYGYGHVPLKYQIWDLA